MAPAGIGDSLEGFHAVAAAVAAGRVTHLQVESSRLRHRSYADLVAAARAAGATVAEVDDVRPAAVTEAPQGLVARARPIAPVTLEQAIAATDPAALLVLDRIEDPRNVGAIARSSLAAGVRSLVMATRRAAPLGATAFKAAAGAFEAMELVTVGSVASALASLRRAGVWLVGLDAAGDAPLFGCELLTGPVALVVGAEGRGLSRLVSERLDARVGIPLAAGVESLNASVAAALAVFELARMRGWVT
jgi:23S rRNA (guanosine2251-2'-O)-methyltransferase